MGFQLLAEPVDRVVVEQGGHFGGLPGTVDSPHTQTSTNLPDARARKWPAPSTLCEPQKPHTDIKRYSYRTRWSDDDGAYVATVAEFPYLSCVEDDPGAAL